MDRFYRPFLLIFVCSIVLTITCGELDESIYDPEFNVYGILYSWQHYLDIIIDRTYRMNEPSEPYVDDALVILTTTGYTDTLAFDSVSGHYLSSTFLTIMPGATYELLAAKDGFDTLRGSATVPGDFTILNTEEDTLTLSDTILFTPSTNAAVYDCTLRELATAMEFEFWYFPDKNDTLYTLILGYEVYGIPSSMYRLFITAYDSSYFSYNFKAPDSLYACGVTGGVGLFGSSWTVSKRFFIVNE